MKRAKMQRQILKMAMVFILLWGKMGFAANPLLYLPFAKGDNWYCTQGVGGSYSHSTQPTYYAFDWNKGSTASDSSNPAFNQAIYSPVAGTVVKVDSRVPDFLYNGAGQGAYNNNGWGNQVIIRDSATSKYIRINHMKQYSPVVSVGQFVAVGAYLGRVGKTGFSSGPHVHMQVQNQAEYSDSIPFGFVEGPVYQGSWIKSLNLGNTSVIDNDGAVNLGNELNSSQVTIGGNWTSYSSGSGFNGANYLTHTYVYGDISKVTWNFVVKYSGYYNIMASWIPNSSRDNQTRYIFRGNSTFINQQLVDGIGGDNWTTIYYSVYLAAGTNYTISTQGVTVGRTVMADSIILQRLY